MVSVRGSNITASSDDGGPHTMPPEPSLPSFTPARTRHR